MDQTPAPLTGKILAAPAVPAPAAEPNLRSRRWSVRIGRDWINLSFHSESYGPPLIANRRSSAAIVTAALAGGIALLVVGASAGRAVPATPDRADATIAVPSATPYVAPAPVLPARRPRFQPAAPAPAVATTDTTPALGTLTRSQAIAAAIRTGEFQEWTDRDGASGFAVPGVADVSASGACRPLAVLTRRPDGTDQVSNSKVCTPLTAEN